MTPHTWTSGEIECAHISWGHSVYAKAEGFGTFPRVSELLVRCAKISIPWWGMCILFEVCKKGPKGPFQRGMGHGGGRYHIVEYRS